jgi:hypothetical protein
MALMGLARDSGARAMAQAVERTSTQALHTGVSPAATAATLAAMRTILAAASLAVLLPAQRVCVAGIIEPVPGPTICQQGETHWIPLANVFLRSNTVGLDAYSFRQVVVHGIDVGLLCRVIDVQRIVDPSPVQLLSCGSQMIGCPFKVKVQGPGIGFAAIAASLQPGFQAFSCSGQGPVEHSLLLSAPIVTLVGSTTGTGSVDVVVPIPLQSAFVGMQVWFQGAHMTIGPVGPLLLSNSVLLIPSLLLPPCAPTNC